MAWGQLKAQPATMEKFIFLNKKILIQILDTIFKQFKMCIQDVCSPSELVPVSSCPFSDEPIVNGQIISASLPFTQMTCLEVYNYIYLNLNQFPNYCATNSDFAKSCCNFCGSTLFQMYRNVSCADSDSVTCPGYASYCATPLATIGNQTVKQYCPLTCGVCKSKFHCNHIVY